MKQKNLIGKLPVENETEEEKSEKQLLTMHKELV